jgi:hypothetical protein
LVVSEPGGTLQGRTLHVPGSTAFLTGEAVTVFLYRTPIGCFRTTNYGQGKFALSPDGRVHANRAMNLAGAVRAITPSTSGGTSIESRFMVD